MKNRFWRNLSDVILFGKTFDTEKELLEHCCKEFLEHCFKEFLEHCYKEFLEQSDKESLEHCYGNRFSPPDELFSP